MEIEGNSQRRKNGGVTGDGKNLEMPRWYAPLGGTGLAARRLRRGYNTAWLKWALRVWEVVLGRIGSL